MESGLISLRSKKQRCRKMILRPSFASIGEEGPFWSYWGQFPIRKIKIKQNYDNEAAVIEAKSDIGNLEIDANKKLFTSFRRLYKKHNGNLDGIWIKSMELDWLSLRTTLWRNDPYDTTFLDKRPACQTRLIIPKEPKVPNWQQHIGQIYSYRYGDFT